MNRLGLINMIIGFSIIFISACAGVFLSDEITKQIFLNGQSPSTWQNTLARSAHGHFNLFGMIHIVFGLTLPYSVFSRKTHFFQTACLFLGSLAIGPGLWIHSFKPVSLEWQTSNFIIGLFVSLALAVIFMHIISLSIKTSRN